MRSRGWYRRCFSLAQSIVFVFLYWHGLGSLTVVSGGAGPMDMAEFNALEDLYNSAHGEGWTWPANPLINGKPWNFSDPVGNNPCNDFWAGLFCTLSSCRPSGVGCNIFSISLSDMNLTGTLPSSMNAFSHLQYIFLGGNHLEGSLPQLTGPVTFMNISHNQFNGPFSNDFLANSSLQDLSLLYASHNLFTGPLPQVFRDLVGLQYLSVSSNGFSGSVPSFIGSLHNLSYLSLGENQFNGSIPQELSSLSKLEVLYLYNNSFSGPWLESGLPRLRYLWISRNDFSGPFPESLCASRQLKYITLFDNMFSGTLPACLHSLPELTSFQIQNNSFAGSLETVFNASIQSQLRYVDLSNNAFSGDFPSEVFLLPALQSVAAVKNCFEGTLPESICQSGQNLSVIALDGMRASEECLNYLWDPWKVTVGYYSDLMQGSIPSCVWLLPQISVLHFSGNGFEGTLPTQFANNASALVDVALNHNILTGTIPLAIQSAPFQFLDLSYNKFFGSIENIDHMPFRNDSTTTSSSDNSNSNGAVLKLDQNRFSGRLSKLFRQAESINILNGNMFACDDDTLPIHDPHYHNYLCGSQEYDHAVIAFCALVGIIVTVFIFIVFSAKSCWKRVQARFTQWIAQLRFCFFYLMSLKKFERILREEAPCSTFLIDIDGSQRHTFSRQSSLSRALHRWSEQSTQSIDHFFEIEHVQRHRNLFNFLSVLTFLREVGERLALLALCICLPVYLILYTINPRDETTYSTHQDRYGWVTTSAFLSGYLPAVLLFCLWMCILILCFVKLIWHFQLFVREDTWLSRKWKSWKSFLWWNRNSSSNLEDSLLDFQRSNSSHDDDAHSPMPPEIIATSSPPAVPAELERKSKDVIGLKRYDDPETSHVQFWLKYSLIVVVNLIVGIFINILYLQYQNDSITSTQSKLGMQFGMALFKVLWSMIVIRTMINTLTFNRHSVMLHVMMLLVNGIIAPCIATAFSDQACFRDFFQGSDPITTSYSVPFCQSFTQAVNPIDYSWYLTCESYADTTFATVYTPGFIYYYTCRSKLLSLYIPVYFYIYSMLLIGIPLMMLAQALISDMPTIRRHHPWVLSMIKLVVRAQDWHDCHLMQQPSSAASSSLTPMPATMIIRGDSILVSQINHLVVLLTFGLMSPILALVIGLAMCTNTLAWQMAIIRFMEYDNTSAPFGKEAEHSPKHVGNTESLTRSDPQRSTDEKVRRETNVNPQDSYRQNAQSTEQRMHTLNAAIGHTWICPKKAKWLIMYCCMLFYGVMVFDMLGDKFGWKVATGSMIIVIGLMILFRVILLDLVLASFQLWAKHLREKRHSILSDWSVSGFSA